MLSESFNTMMELQAQVNNIPLTIIKKRIFKGLEAINPVYAGIVSELAQSAGIIAEEWQWCARTNSTYVDCPISNHADSENVKMVVAVHNPANLEMNVVQIAVPHGKFQV